MAFHHRSCNEPSSQVASCTLGVKNGRRVPSSTKSIQSHQWRLRNYKTVDNLHPAFGFLFSEKARCPSRSGIRRGWLGCRRIRPLRGPGELSLASEAPMAQWGPRQHAPSRRRRLGSGGMLGICRFVFVMPRLVRAPRSSGGRDNSLPCYSQVLSVLYVAVPCQRLHVARDDLQFASEMRFGNASD